MGGSDGARDEVLESAAFEDFDRGLGRTAGDVTRARNSAGEALSSLSMRAAPSIVWSTSVRAVSGGSPCACAASSIASASRKT